MLEQEDKSTNGQIPESVWKPLGRGYDQFPDFFLQYCSRSDASNSNPDLAISLNAFATSKAASLIRNMGPQPRCLIQGIACPRNGTALRRYLLQIGITDPTIHAIDIVDVAAVAHATGHELTDLEFSLRDASRLFDWAHGSVQILVQDHLLNCAPHADHEAILREAARVLSPGGILMLNFSLLDFSGNQMGNECWLNWSDAERLLGTRLSDEVYCLKDIVGDGRRLAEVKPLMLGRVIADYKLDRQVEVTYPHGNFEFYFSMRDLKRLLERVGMRFCLRYRSKVENLGGPRYVRYRTLVRHAEEVG
jgi:SAM-dependent methyltransferase